MTVVAPDPTTTTWSDRRFRAAARRRELGSFLRVARERAKPGQHGIAVGARRRAPGLLREEVARLAAISASWYSWLEQGRPIQVSEQVLTAVADVLRLTPIERDHVFALAGLAPPGSADIVRRPDSAEDDALRRMIHQLPDTPAYLVDRYWNIVEWNDALVATFGSSLAELPEQDRNALRLALICTSGPLRFADPIAGAHLSVAQFRADTTPLIGDAVFEEQIERLLDDSRLFRALWPLREVHRRAVGSLAYQHESRGLLRYDFVSTTVDQGASLRMHTFLAAPADPAPWTRT